jgi:hypothetical protein
VSAPAHLTNVERVPQPAKVDLTITVDTAAVPRNGPADGGVDAELVGEGPVMAAHQPCLKAVPGGEVTPARL